MSKSRKAMADVFEFNLCFSSKNAYFSCESEWGLDFMVILL